MAFILFMISFALVLVFILWMIFRPGKPQPTKKTKRQAKKIPPKVKTPATENSPLNTEPEAPSDEFMKEVATELLKKNPQVVSHVVKQWLRK
jgi:flagellar biosynthesis/type III secretory pathway M-ring protein FliF/YscJ